MLKATRCTDFLSLIAGQSLATDVSRRQAVWRAHFAMVRVLVEREKNVSTPAMALANDFATVARLVNK